MAEHRAIEESVKSFRIQRREYPIYHSGSREKREEYRCACIDSLVYAREIGNQYMRYALDA